MSIMNLCNCGGPDPSAGQHEPHCLENGITQSLDREHPWWSFNCPQCPYRSPIKHPNELAARTAFQGHIQGCSGREPARADGYTEEQIKRWCACGTTYATYDGPEKDCPLHGGYDVEWLSFSREVSLLPEDFKPIGLARGTAEYDSNPRTMQEALQEAEYELASIRRHDERTTPSREFEYELRYRLIGPWLRPNDA
jgi:hypothetical protein